MQALKLLYGRGVPQSEVVDVTDRLDVDLDGFVDSQHYLVSTFRTPLRLKKMARTLLVEQKQCGTLLGDQVGPSLWRG